MAGRTEHTTKVARSSHFAPCTEYCLFQDVPARLTVVQVIERESKMTAPESIVAVLRECLPDLVAVYRFGSVADGTARPDSDLDLAVLCDGPLSYETRFELIGQLAMLSGRPVDLIDLSTASTVMRAQIVTTGKRFYCVDAPRCETFEDFVLSSYARLNEERRAILRDIKSRETVYG